MTDREFEKKFSEGAACIAAANVHLARGEIYLAEEKTKRAEQLTAELLGANVTRRQAAKK